MQCGSQLIKILWLTSRFYVVQGKESTLGVSCCKGFCSVLPWQVFIPGKCAARELRELYLAFCLL